MNLDNLLSEPLPEIPDRHFSARVMAALVRHEIRRARIEAAAWTLLAIAVLGTLAVTQTGHRLAATALSLDPVAQLCVGLVVLLLLFSPRLAPE